MNKRTVITIAVISLALLVSLLGFIWVALARHDATIYATGFSEAKFRQVHKGMTKADVGRIIGKPLRNDQEGHVQGIMDEENRWHYAFLDRAKIPHDDRVTNTWYKVREIDFDGHGKVKAVLISTEQFQ